MFEKNSYFKLVYTKNRKCGEGVGSGHRRGSDDGHGDDT